MIGIDFNLSLNVGQYAFINPLKGLANAFRTYGFLTTNGLSSKETFRQMRSQIRRQSSSKNFFLFRSISVHGFCPDNISSEPSGHRNLSASNAAKTLPLRHMRECFTQYLGKCKRTSKLENIRRFCSGVDKQSSNTLCQRGLRHSTEPRGLCSGFNDHRFMSFTISMGKISQTQSRSKDTHADGLKRLYTRFYPYYRWESSRCKYPRRTDFRAGRNLYNGPCLSRFCSSLYFHSKPFNFHHKSQKQFRLQLHLLPPGRQDNGPSMRPDDSAQRLLRFAGLSCCTSSNRLLRHRDESKVRISDEQFCVVGLDNHAALQMPLADRNLLQMDQAVFADQNIFRHHRECGEDSNLDCRQRLCFGSDSQEGTENRVEFGRNPANSQHCAFRESLYYTSTYEKCFAKRNLPIS